MIRQLRFAPNSNRNAASSFRACAKLKTNFKRSSYINKLPNNLCKILMAFITRNHRLPIETDRWQNIPVQQRQCPNCDEIGDEFHYIFVCSLFSGTRMKYIERSLINRPNMPKFINLICSDNVAELENLGIFCSFLMNHFKRL